MRSQVKDFRAGRIKQFYPLWETLTSDTEVLGTVRGQRIEFTKTPLQLKAPKQKKFSLTEKSIIDNEIVKLLNKGVIELTERGPLDYLSTIFLRPKTDGTHRMILNLKQLNKKVVYHHFKMDTLWSVIHMMKPGCYMASIDIKDAYYSVPIDDYDRRFLKFEWDSNIYQFTCFPNGLALCPRKFTKLLKPVYHNLRVHGHVSLGYIDDSYLQGDTYQECLANIVATVKLFHSLGFVVHPEKSTFIPTQRITFLGFILDSRTMEIYLTKEKTEKLKNACLDILNTPKPALRSIARLLGLMTSNFPGSMYGPLHYRKLDMELTRGLGYQRDFEKQITLPMDVLEDIQWWLKNVDESRNVITHGDFQITLSTDASSTGWGCECLGVATGGAWSSIEAKHHINYLEMLAVILALQSFEKDVAGKHVKILVDNMTTVNILNNMGTSHSRDLNNLSFCIWQWCIDRNIWVTVAHIPGKTNIVADRESRAKQYSTEWSLDQEIFYLCMKKLAVEPTIDLFASRLNNKLDRYVAYKPDPTAFAIDAFTICWSKYLFFAFPPFSIIMKSLQKISEDRGTGIMIVPHWPTQAWWPMLTRLLIQAPVIIPRKKGILHLPQDPKAVHPLLKQMTLLACHLSGDSARTKDFVNKLPPSSWSPGEVAPSLNTEHTLRNGQSTVINGKLILFHHL